MQRVLFGIRPNKRKPLIPTVAEKCTVAHSTALIIGKIRIGTSPNQIFNKNE